MPQDISAQSPWHMHFNLLQFKIFFFGGSGNIFPIYLVDLSETRDKRKPETNVEDVYVFGMGGSGIKTGKFVIP